MEVEFAFLADAAEASSDGKLYALGAGISVIRSQAFPVSHPHIAFVVKLRLHPTECQREHKLEIVLWDPDGRQLGHLDAGFSASRHPEFPGRPAFVQMVFNFANLSFPSPGDYAYHVLVDGQHLKEVPLHLEAHVLGPVQGN